MIAISWPLSSSATTRVTLLQVKCFGKNRQNHHKMMHKNIVNENIFISHKPTRINEKMPLLLVKMQSKHNR